MKTLVARENADYRMTILGNRRGQGSRISWGGVARINGDVAYS
jgi:hypothetical protein